MKQPAIIVPDGLHEVLLHACCAPCSSAIVEWLLANGVRPTIFYYNPNIWPREEYEIRKEESKRHAASLGIEWIDGDYAHEDWLQGVCGLEGEPERGRRCEQCFLLRLTATARKAAELGIPYFATTLASSRWKSLDQINRAGLAAEQCINEGLNGDGSCCVMGMTQKIATPHLHSKNRPQCAPKFWPQNWRKGGLQERRNQLLKEYGFYNQQYCGCEFSAQTGGRLSKSLLRQQMRTAKQQHQSQLAGMSADVVSRLRERLWGRFSLCHAHDIEEPSPQCTGEPSPQCTPLTILAYWPLPDEVDIRPLISEMVAAGHTVLLPKVLDDEHMELRRYISSADMAEGPFHILEPVGAPFTDYDQIDVCLIPGMAFDAAGHRLGRGRGYYDRFLATLRPSPLTIHHSPVTIGVCFPFQRVPFVPTDVHDMAVDEVV